MKRGMRKTTSYSILMSVYAKENPFFLRESIDSMLGQTLPFDEFVIVKDGKLTKELDETIDSYAKRDKRFVIVELDKNCGLGIALELGLKRCKNDLIIRMDSDDISLRNRAEEQIAFMENNPSIDVCGGDIYEFKQSVDEPGRRLKEMPTGAGIDHYIQKRNPLNHMTVCFRKKKIEKVGGYQDIPCMEDYWLWVRLYKDGGRIENVSKVLTYARIGNGFEKRRGNKAQVKSWKKIQTYMLANKMISRWRKIKNDFNMWCIVHMPTPARKATYKYLRKKDSTSND